MPSIRRPAIDLRALARTDPATADVGRQLNTTAEGGVDLDGDPMTLTFEEYQLAKARYGPLIAQHAWFATAVSQLDVRFGQVSARTPTTPTHTGPVSRADIETLTTGGIGMPAGMVHHRGGARTAFASRWNADGTSELVARRDAGDGRFGPEHLIATGVDNGTTASVRGRDWLYSIEAGTAGAALKRRLVMEDGLGRAEDVPVRGRPAAMVWVQAATAPDGSVLLGFSEPLRAPYTAVSTDGGASFRASAPLALEGADSGALVHVAVAKDGTKFMTQQRMNADGTFSSFIRSSADGLQWSSPRVLTTSADVHDAFPIARQDGGVDVYFLMRSDAAGGFVTYRKPVSASLSMGPEQRVTADDVGPVEKPQPRRLADGSIGLMFARNVVFGQSYDVAYARIGGDAPLA